MSRDDVSGILDVESPFDHGLYKISPGAEDHSHNSEPNPEERVIVEPEEAGACVAE